MAKKKQKQKQATPKPAVQKQENTLMGDKLWIVECPQRIWRTIKRRLGDLVGRRITPQASEDSGIMTMPPPAGGDTAFRFTGLLILCITLLIMVFGGILGARLYSVLGMGTNRVKNIPVVYLQDEHVLKFKGPLMDVPVTITDELMFDGAGGYNLDKNTVISEDGGELLYLNNLSNGVGELFLRNTDREKPRNKDGDSRGQLIATGVLQGSLYFVEDDKAVLYMREGSTEGGTLLRWSNGKEQELDSRIHSILGISQDNYLYYTVYREKSLIGGDGYEDYSLCRIGQSGTRQTLAEGLGGQIIEFIPETGSVLYSLSAERGNIGETLLTLIYWNGSSTQVVAEDISSLVDFGKNGAVFSVGMTSDKSNPFEYFEDDMAVQDANMKEPEEKDFMVETTNLWGKKKTELDKTAYENAVTAYEAKLNRDNIRKAIAAQERNVKRSILYHSAGSSRTSVDSGIAQIMDADAAAGVAVYVKERIPTPQKFKVSQVSDPFDAIRLLNTVLITTVKDYYYASVGREAVMFLSTTKNERMRVELDGSKGIYFIKEDVNGEGAPLNYISAQEAGLGVAKKLDDKVLSLTGLTFREQMLYLREDSVEDTVTICATSGQDRERLVDGLPIYPLPIAYGDVLLCYRDYSDGRQIGSLTMYNSKGKIKPVARNAHSYSYRLPDYIYVIKDYDANLKLGDLYLYSGNSEKLTLIDTDISDIKTN